VYFETYKNKKRGVKPKIVALEITPSGYDVDLPPRKPVQRMS